MKQMCKILALGMTVMFLLQSCVTVRRPRHRHHHHRHCYVIMQQTTDTASFNHSPAKCIIALESAVYENKG